MIKVSVKWNKQAFDNIELDPALGVEVFKAQLFDLSNVPTEKQKIMYKGKILKDDTDLSSLGLPASGAQFMLMGTAVGGELKKPAEQVKFLEDMTAEEKARILHEKTGETLPAGLENLGNTCYMNATVQCLKRVNELKEGLKNYQEGLPGAGAAAYDQGKIMARAGKQLMTNLEFKGEPFAPFQFVQALRQVYPQFNETDDHGHHKQQDAEECYTALLSAFKSALKLSPEERVEGGADDLVEKLFGIEMVNTLKNKESEEEPVQETKEQVLRLSCHIDNNATPVNHMAEGLKLSLEGDIEKQSALLGRNCVYFRQQKVNRLPSYLTVHFVRFYWKKDSASSGTKAGKAKILRNVSFPKTFDIYDFCTDELKKSLDLGREFERRLREEEDAKRLSGKDVEMADATSTAATEESKVAKPVDKKALKEQEIKLSDEMLYRPHGQGLDAGHYQLVAVVTHKGRSADGGHYVGWVHKSGDEWLQYDDDIVSTVKIDDILALRGGGDWHTAYLCIYRKTEATK